jgi:hypothetical protein
MRGPHVIYESWSGAVKQGRVRRAGEEVVAELVELVRQRIGGIKQVADGVAYTMPPTIDDPAILDEIAADPAGIRYPGSR